MRAGKAFFFSGTKIGRIFTLDSTFRYHFFAAGTETLVGEPALAAFFSA